ncbi:hypothetical protein P5P86_11785 [Nocardioides sp. BP30]|uniref:hypothetical protein n=1 Tax=Nocardioides sp. BP30 TaxID=3036374 RepID=UPI002468538C|nr:hypothetical protein [Nocardioides sp. BP30]WGL50645.1 hypothetical protein P5P86_11785 [Nocardioides sp. BP30]
MAEVFVANKTAIVDYEGAPTRIRKGVTRVEESHALLKDHPDLFSPAEASSQFRVRDARDEPGAAYASLNAKDLKAEIAKRNEDREDDRKIVPAGRKNHDLVAALVADDAQASQTGAAADAADGEGAGDTPDAGEPAGPEPGTDAEPES